MTKKERITELEKRLAKAEQRIAELDLRLRDYIDKHDTTFGPIKPPPYVPNFTMPEYGPPCYVDDLTPNITPSTIGDWPPPPPVTCGSAYFPDPPEIPRPSVIPPTYPRYYIEDDGK